MMAGRGILRATVAGAVLLASALAAGAELPASALKARKITAGGKPYLVQIDQRMIDPETRLPDGTVVRAWRYVLTVAVSRGAAPDFTRSATDRAEARGVAAGYCRAMGLTVGKGRVSAVFDPGQGGDNPDWNFDGLCLDPAETGGAAK